MSLPADQLIYQMPPKAIADLVDAPATPGLSLDPSRSRLLVMERPGLVSVDELSCPELRLAGLRIDPETNGSSRQPYITGLRIMPLSDGPDITVAGVPQGGRIRHPQWSPDGCQVAFTVVGEGGIELFVATAASGDCRLVSGGRLLNASMGTPFSWAPDSRSLICALIPQGRGSEPTVPRVPEGPVIQENLSGVAPSRTYQDLLKNPSDEQLFEYFTTSQVARVGTDASVQELGEPGIYHEVTPSPDGRYLLAESFHRPFSYLVPCSRFPHRVEVWDSDGASVTSLCDLPLAESVPIAFDGVRTGPRFHEWRADAPATLAWAEAQDGGDPSQEADVRDIVYTLSAPFDGPPCVLTSLAFRFNQLTWGNGDLAIVGERWWKTRRTRTWVTAPDRVDGERRLLFDHSFEDRYHDPGSPLVKPTPDGGRVLLTGDGDGSLFLAGNGASDEGDRPFLDRFDLETGKAERLWQSEAPAYERPIDLLDVESRILLTLRETVDEPPNLFIRSLGDGVARQVTAFPHPMPQLAEVKKELIRYTRDDGVQLTGTLYLPPGYSADEGPLPLVMWAYPREFKSRAAAGQVKDSPYRFVQITSGSPLYLLMEGYAVLDGPTMPIVGEGEEEANDTYVEQLTSSARAAVEEVVRRGVADPQRLAVGGHSYGGFMTANLLAHTDLFKAGVARSGAYNRTLTPFGFQSEERTLWEAPEVYAAMSPFMHADKIKAPILLIHGEADNNSGTFPIQSERFYNALKGHGATTRLVILPHESHGYRARESVMHMLWEMVTWLGEYVKESRQ